MAVKGLKSLSVNQHTGICMAQIHTVSSLPPPNPPDPPQQKVTYLGAHKQLVSVMTVNQTFIYDLLNTLRLCLLQTVCIDSTVITNHDAMLVLMFYTLIKKIRFSPAKHTNLPRFTQTFTSDLVNTFRLCLLQTVCIDSTVITNHDAMLVLMFYTLIKIKIKISPTKHT